MIIKKSELKLVKTITRVPQVFLFNQEIDPGMLTNIMLSKLEEIGGVSLSANQVGLDFKMFVMGIKDVRLEVFNPVITHHSTDMVVMEEGCLFYPGLKINVRRPRSIMVEYYNKSGEKIEAEFHGLTARIFQHEYDHMEGKTLKDVVSKLKWDMATKRFTNKKEKLIKKYTQKTLQAIQKDIEAARNENT